ncbi:hypothetical protein N7457_006932 [Penicillium paradoxum]|uniref:uncharacterized protein n=1 Tax=Penicillium paradoxum TaxID=176176 RepID=UPI002549AB6C|nr:uncharacterized protein N7457_006932 [Penicillium paradoxum]KAJ5779212.1 hypothetical protein N7457_006932 [Penicillium paradoxum]
MHFPILLLGASLVSAQYSQPYGPSQDQLDFMEHINEHPNSNLPNPHNGNYNGEIYKDHDNYDITVSRPHVQAQPPAPMVHNTFVVRPSPAPIARPQAQLPAQAQHPDQQTPQKKNQARSADFIPRDMPAGAVGKVAPVDPLKPGWHTAPGPFDRPPQGRDEGNTFCFGQCYADESQLECSKSYVSFG